MTGSIQARLPDHQQNDRDHDGKNDGREREPDAEQARISVGERPRPSAACRAMLRRRISMRNDTSQAATTAT